MIIPVCGVGAVVLTLNLSIASAVADPVTIKFCTYVVELPIDCPVPMFILDPKTNAVDAPAHIVLPTPAMNELPLPDIVLECPPAIVLESLGPYILLLYPPPIALRH